MRRLPFLMAAMLLILIAVNIPRLRSSEQDSFPHEKHSHLFPSCKSCHDILGKGGSGALVSATPATCANCHDGVTQPKVNWQPGPGKATNLIFSHDLHVKENGLECAVCHEPEGSAGGMAPKVHPKPEVCIQCHDAKSHLAADNTCGTCHRSLAAATDLTADQVSEFPAPDDHSDAAWWSVHGQAATANGARCAVCHARETCETCHLNAGSLDAIQKLPRDARVADQVAIISPSWPKPASHDTLWAAGHGAAARQGIAECATCHAQSSCSGCHGEGSLASGGASGLVARLPVPAAGGPQGVQLPAHRPPGHTPEFRLAHGAAAITGNPRCASCHDAASYCGACHEAPRAPEFHPTGYLDRHAADVYSRDKDCASCHSSETFCRACHENVGLSTRNSKNMSYHDAQPLWLINHGNAARQGLEACASCHQQTDCLQCHSAKTGWHVNPHGPDFDAGRMADKSPMMCARCHFTTPAP